MSKQYVVIFSIGPVQGFIASARKSRDLWSGSWLLSELSKACALSLYKQDATLIFPSIVDPKVLSPNSDLSVGNKIQVIVQANTEQELLSVINQAKQATLQHFLDVATQAKDRLKNQSDLRLELWQKQLDDYVEIQTAWALVVPSESSQSKGYKEAVDKASKVLAARKATRDFKAAAKDPYDSALMIPKSSLDGARETVLQEISLKKSHITRLQLSLSDSEQLDCVGIVKRLGLHDVAEQFTPFTRVAAQAWVEKVSEEPGFNEVKSIYDRLVSIDLATRVSGNDKIYQSFAYDAQYLYKYRLEAAKQENKDNPEAIALLEELSKSLKELWKKYGQPYSYGVLLLADGDKMGELLDQASTVEQHQTITQKLSDFAQSVPKLLRDYQGHCIYSGGDDVLAFVPLHTAYDCAKKLSEAFYKALKPVAETLKVGAFPTLSVGLAICHINTPLSVIRDLASRAEKLAKGDHCSNPQERRNALGMVLSIRSGNDTNLRLRWNDIEAHEALKQWVEFYVKKEIPSRVAYDMRAIHLRTHNISKNMALLKDIQSAELIRMMKKARLQSGHKLSEQTIGSLRKRAQAIDLSELSDELIVARWLAAKLQNDLGKE